jgi:hypothetical protein
LLLTKKKHVLEREKTIDGQVFVLLFGEWVEKDYVLA